MHIAKRFLFFLKSIFGCEGSLRPPRSSSRARCSAPLAQRWAAERQPGPAAARGPILDHVGVFRVQTEMVLFA